MELNQKIFQETGSPITSYSLRDLDDNNYNTTSKQLFDNGKNEQRDDSGEHVIMRYRTLRRREIENYLIIPEAISRYILSNCRNSEISKDADSVKRYLINEHGLVVPETFKISDRTSSTEALFIKDVKTVLVGLNSYFQVRFDKEEYINSINSDEICDDIMTVIDEIIEMCTLD